LEINKKAMHTDRKIRYILIVLALIFNVLSLNAINYFSVKGARTAAMGGVSVALKDKSALFNNPAIMAFGDEISVGLHYDNRFLLKETSTSSLGFVLPVEKVGAFGLQLSHFGHVNYGELHTGFSYAKSFGNIISFGLGFHYLMNYFSEKTYGNCHGFTFDIGVYGQISQRLGMGFHAFNPARLKMCTYNDTKEYIPTILRLGLSYDLSKKCILAAEIEKDLDKKFVYRVGLEYSILEQLQIRTGCGFPYFECSLGAGWKTNYLMVDFAFSYHFVLGYSPRISLIYNIKQTK